MEARDTLLLSCGSAEFRASLRPLFEDSFNLLEAANGQQTKLFLQQNLSCIAAVILNIADPTKVDASIMQDPEFTALLTDIPLVLIANKDRPQVVSEVFDFGATDVYPPNVRPELLQYRIHNIVELYRHKWYLQDLVDEQAAVLRHSNDAMVDALSSIIEYRSVESGQHILRIRRFTQILLEEVARCCPEYELNPTAIRLISSASALHDIGKISIPDAILNKPGKLTADEWEVMESHSLTGCRILESLGDIGDPDYLRYGHNICHYHHERWDGNGYPEGLAGDEIPICAQVVGLADAYDALTSKRVYKDAYSYDKSANMIVNGECGVFSPKLLECFKHVAPQFAELAQAYADGQAPKAENFDVTLPPPARTTDHNTLQAVQSKYQSLLHYTNAAVIEVDLDQGLYHLLYNPDPNLIMLRSSDSFAETMHSLQQYVLMPEERAHFETILYEDIPAFLEDGLHRRSYTLMVRDRATGKGVPYECTLLRLDPAEEDQKRLIILWKRLPAEPEAHAPEAPMQSHFDTLYELCRFRNDAALTIEGGMEGLTRLTAFSPEEIQYRFQNHLIAMVLPQDRKGVREKFNDQLSFGNDVQLTYRMMHKSGSFVWVLHKSQLVLGEDGAEHLYTTLVDVTRAKSAQENYNLTLEQYQLILSQTGNIVFDWDLVTDTASFSVTYQDIFGYQPLGNNFFKHLPTHSHVHPDDVPRFFEWVNDIIENDSKQTIDIRVANSEGRYLWCRHRATVMRDATGRATHILGIIINITKDRQTLLALQEHAERDQLTRLLNKQTARKRIEDYLAENDEPCALLIIDLDNFKHVNDQYGHMFGDSILTKTAQELKKLFRAHDIVARIGGDEFLVLMRGVNDRELVDRRCSSLITAIGQIADRYVPRSDLGSSIGVAFAPIHGTTYHDLFQNADRALYQAKDLGKNRAAFYDSKDPVYQLRRQASTPERTQIDSEEQPGLANGGIVQYAIRKLHSISDANEAINAILELAGRLVNVSRVYIFENNADNTTCSNTFEWCNDGIPPEIDNLQDISYETDIPNYEDNFNEQGIFYCADVSELAPNLREILEPQGVKSLLHCAIRDNGVFRGYIGFDDCRAPHMWTRDQIETLTFFCEMLSTYLLKERAQKELEELRKQLKK